MFCSDCEGSAACVLRITDKLTRVQAYSAAKFSHSIFQPNQNWKRDFRTDDRQHDSNEQSNPGTDREYQLR